MLSLRAPERGGVHSGRVRPICGPFRSRRPTRPTPMRLCRAEAISSRSCAVGGSTQCKGIDGSRLARACAIASRNSIGCLGQASITPARPGSVASAPHFAPPFLEAIAFSVEFRRCSNPPGGHSPQASIRKAKYRPVNPGDLRFRRKPCPRAFNATPSPTSKVCRTTGATCDRCSAGGARLINQT